MQIQTIEEKTGLDRATIRYYEQEGLIIPQRLQNGYRDYSEKNLQDLQKVKLLRQLGLSLEAILQLIEGKDDLKSALENQLIVLKNHKAQVENAEAICKMILQDNVTYETIVPNKYHINTSENKGIVNPVNETPHTEYVYLESHPVRRYVGRYLDQLLTSAILMLIFVVILRIRPFGDLQNNLVSIAALFLTMPINALFLCLLGTTPGKFVVGIFLKTPEGKNMSFIDALKREWSVFRFGMGYNIPFYNWVRLYKSYKIHTEGRELEWDYEHNADMLYTEWETKRGVYCAILGIICAVTITFSATDALMPAHRTADLTLAQFAENYNDYAKQNNMTTYLSKEGEWYTFNSGPSSTTVEIPEREESWYFGTDSDNILEEITVIIKSDSKIFSTEKVSYIIHTAIMSQPGADIMTAGDAMDQLSEIIFNANYGVTDYVREELNFDGVNIIIEVKLPDYNSGSPSILFINIRLP